MADYDIFNGDADGICALTQLRLAQPRQSTLVTGVKRDISLLKTITPRAGDRITVLDVAMEKNQPALSEALEVGTEVFYVDHHKPGPIPEHPNLKATINESADVCTSLLINHHLNGQYLEWAIVGTFGDNLDKSAAGMAKNSTLSESQLAQLRDLGIYINYNGYGAKLDELHFHPRELYQLVSQHQTPFDFIADNRAAFDKLEHGYKSDMQAAADLQSEVASASSAVFMLPDAPWARRVSGVYSNDLANNNPNRAHAIITAKDDGNYLVSVRAPLNNKQGAADLCSQFPTGGGRAAAAGINDLPADQLDSFINAFAATYRR